MPGKFAQLLDKLVERLFGADTYTFKNNQITPTSTPTPTPTPTPVQYRNPKWGQWKTNQPKSFQELLSGTRIASEKHGVPQDLLMDISGIETTGGKYLDQMGGGPGKGYFQFENAIGINPYSATESADLAAKNIKNSRLSKWGLPQKYMLDKYWGSVDNPNNTNGKLTDFYKIRELNRYLAPKYRF